MVHASARKIRMAAPILRDINFFLAYIISLFSIFKYLMAHSFSECYNKTCRSSYVFGPCRPARPPRHAFGEMRSSVKALIGCIITEAASGIYTPKRQPIIRKQNSLPRSPTIESLTAIPGLESSPESMAVFLAASSRVFQHVWY